MDEREIIGGNIIMGSSINYSSYSGKGSTAPSKSKKTSKAKSKSPMVEMLELLEEVERCRDVVSEKQADLDSAKKKLEIAEQKVYAQMDRLDPETKDRLKRMMGRLDEKEQDGEER